MRWSSCAVMGVVNVTPDSFSDGGQFLDVDAAVAHGLLLASQGAMIVDIGGESTRPGSTGVDIDTELARVIPVIERLTPLLTSVGGGDVRISIDTRKPTVAAAAIAAGASIVNDITALEDPEMVAVCADAGVPAVLVHMLGRPEDMQIDPRYDDVLGEVSAFLDDRAAAVLRAGVPSVLVDPGIGFGKTLAHNVALLRALPLGLPYPVLVGASRKRLIQTLAGIDPSADRDAGSVAVHLFAARRGAAMVRVHDVAAHAQALAVAAALEPACDQPS
jgi:dihydropteroate synthase